jgi:hypothetical protein
MVTQKVRGVPFGAGRMRLLGVVSADQAEPPAGHDMAAEEEGDDDDDDDDDVGSRELGNSLLACGVSS